MTVAEALRRGTERLRKAGVPDPGWNAERLLAFALGHSRAELLANGPLPLGPEGEKHYALLLEERAQRRPLQHLIGTQAFWRHEFKVTPDVLIPRPETEILVEASLRLLKDTPDPVLVDVGTGCGCIALSLAAERGDATVHAVDVSPAALAVARENAERLGLGSRILFHLGDLLEPLAALVGGVDLVVSNPPYVDPSESAALPPEIRDHEPSVALFPPGGRYAIYPRLGASARRVLRHGGSLVVEIGRGMDGEVARLLREAGLEVKEILPDLQAIPRSLVARLPHSSPLAVD